MPARYLNDMIVPNASIMLKRGDIYDVRSIPGTTISLHDTICSGEMIAKYRSFKFNLFESIDDNNKKVMLTMLSNIVLSKNNHKKRGKIFYVRQPDDSFLRFVWVGIRSGLKDTVLPGFLSDKEMN